MNEVAWLKNTFSFLNFSISVGQLLGIAITIFLVGFLYILVVRRILPWYYTYDSGVDANQKRSNLRIIVSILVLALIIGFLIFLGADLLLYQYEDFELRITKIFEGLLILQLARLLDRTLSRVLAASYEKSHPDEELSKKVNPNRGAGKTIQYIVYIAALLYAVRTLRFDFSHTVGSINLSISGILVAILILLMARLLVWIFTQIVMDGYYKRKSVNTGSQYAINQLIKYVFFVIAILLALDNMGIQMTVLWGGAAALLVGIGLGLQQTFMDFFSGIILLFERTVEVSDVVSVDGLVGTITQIGLRTSNLLTRENINVIIPNSKLTMDNVTNWSHFTEYVRFSVPVGVAYGSDTNKVKKVLMAIANENPYVMTTPSAFVRFADFGDSSLNMELHFWTKNLLIAEDIKSDIRFAINDAFIEKEIEIPFPQRVIHKGPSMNL
jgi:small-conductance mechanosensitive channel